MKIYPGNHAIKYSEDVTVNTLPLANLSEIKKDVTTEIVVNDKFLHADIEKIAYPYQSFTTDKVMLFDTDNKPIEFSGDYLVQSGDKYYFKLKNSVEFTPETFNYSVLVKREADYDAGKQYNINIACYDMQLAETVAALFAPTSVFKPDNITINDNDYHISSFLNRTLEDTDFIFIDENDLSEELLELFTESHVNVIAIDFAEKYFTEADNDTSYTYLNNMIYSSNVFAAKDFLAKNANFETIEANYNNKDFQVINVFQDNSPIALLNKPGSAYLLLIESNVINHSDYTYKLIFELLMNMYLNSYWQSRTRQQYIADNKIDYYIRLNKTYNAYHPKISLDEIFLEDNFDDSINHVIYEIITDRKDIVYLGKDKYNNLLFRKTSKTDPKKEDNALSVFSANNTVINYNAQNNVIKILEDTFNIKLITVDDKNYLAISPFRSSSERIYSPKLQIIEIGDRADVIVIYDHEAKMFRIVDTTAYNEKLYGTRFASVKTDYSSEPSCYDTRIYGGGEIDANDNYEMIDTGCLYGRPYRLGSIMIVKIPAIYQKLEKEIKAELTKHVSSGDYFLLVFE